MAGSASPSIARTNTSRPAARQLSMICCGKPPLPAMMPNGPWGGLIGGSWAGASRLAAIRPFRLADRAVRVRPDKGDDVIDRTDPAEPLGRFIDPIVERP